MWFPKNATIIDYLKYFFKKSKMKIAFCSDLISNKMFLTPYITKYNSLMASTRLRVNDVIYYSLNCKEINLRFYNPFEKFDIIIFQKNFRKEAYLLASRYKQKKSKIVLDININYFNPKSRDIKRNQYLDIKNFLKVTDFIFTTTDYLKEYILKNNFFFKVVTIPEIISNDFFRVKKIHKKKNIINFLYVGYSSKAFELELIKDELEQLSRFYNVRLITICEKVPKLNIKIKKSFIKYNQSRLALDMIKGDIFLNPRDLSNSYNLGHSFTKIGYPMALGIPVVASPVPSYLNTPAVICKNNENWFNLIENLINDYEIRTQLGKKGRIFCYNNFSKEKIMKKYIENFNLILKNE